MRKTVLVIGAGGGVGTEVARLLSGRYQVIATAQNLAKAAAVREANPAVSCVAALDLSAHASLSADLDALLQDVDSLAAVIVCAAVCPNGPLETASADVLRDTLEVNCISHLTIFQRCMPALRRSRGRLIFISSYSGQVGLPFTGLYVASKFALEGLADVMRREVQKWGVEVVLVEPGGIKTAMVTRQMAQLKTATEILPDSERALYGDRYRQFARLMDFGYPQSTPPAEVADVVVRALRSRKPKTRYAVGADAKQFLRMNATHSDRFMDKVLLDIFDSVDAPKVS
jgi:NAD(P)-dependent dehydrogenase (short-subunit alcohol dehydrogenase family)